jgi:hypothetical protein
MNQYSIGSSEFTLISGPGLSGACWLDEDGDGQAGNADVRILQSILQPLATDWTKGKRIYRPNGNNDFCNFSAISGLHNLWAICKNPGSSAIICVDDSIGTQVSKLHAFNTEPDGAVRAQIQDNQSELVGLKICKKIADITLSVNAPINSAQVTLTAGHGAVIGNIICLRHSGRFYQGQVLGVATNLISLDTPLDFAFPAVGTVGFLSSDQMAVNGSVTPQIFSISPPAGTKWDITGCSFWLLDGTAMDDGTFGGIAALAKGIVARKKDWTYKNIFNIKTNGDFAFRCDEVRYADKPPSGSAYGFSAKKTFNIRHGIVIRLDANNSDEFQIIVQDNLTGLSSFKAAIWGHVVS